MEHMDRGHLALPPQQILALGRDQLLRYLRRIKVMTAPSYGGY